MQNYRCHSKLNADDQNNCLFADCCAAYAGDCEGENCDFRYDLHKFDNIDVDEFINKKRDEFIKYWDIYCKEWGLNE